MFNIGDLVIVTSIGSNFNKLIGIVIKIKAPTETYPYAVFLYGKKTKQHLDVCFRIDELKLI